MYFKVMIQSITAGRSFFKHHIDRVEAMNDMEWYPWNDYITILNEISDELDPSVLKSIGKNIIINQKTAFLGSGMTKLSQLFPILNELYKAQIKETPVHEQIETIKSGEYSTVLEMSKNIPVALNEGFYHGFAHIFNEIIKTIDHNLVIRDGYEKMEYRITWK